MSVAVKLDCSLMQILKFAEQIAKQLQAGRSMFSDLLQTLVRRFLSKCKFLMNFPECDNGYQMSSCTTEVVVQQAELEAQGNGVSNPEPAVAPSC